MREELIMLDEGDDVVPTEDKMIPIVLSDKCKVINSVLYVPRSEVLYVAAHIILQVDLIDGRD